MNIILISILVVAALIIFWLISIYNNLVSNRQKVREGWSGIDVQLKRRVDLIPNLIETVKGYAKHEDKVITEVTQLRAGCQNAQNASIQDRAQVESMLSGALGKLMVSVEAYPDLKANQNFIELQKSLLEIEDNIQLARRYYNGSVRDLNIIIESFPSNIVAGKFGFKLESYFEITNPLKEKLCKLNSRKMKLKIFLLALITGFAFSNVALADPSSEVSETAIETSKTEVINPETEAPQVEVVDPKIEAQKALDNKKERILEFVSEIVVDKNSDITVIENIKVMASGQKIKRGISRRWLLSDLGYDYKILSVKKNGIDEPYEVSAEYGSLTISTGRESVSLQPGIYEYQITYKASDQVNFSEVRDRYVIYRDVTGIWDFDIEKSVAKIHLPNGAKITSQEAWAGSREEKNYEFSFDKDNNPIFTTNKTLNNNRTLKIHQYFTVAVTFPKGVVRQVSFLERHYKELLCLIAIFLYYLMVWNKVGRDPKKGTIIPLFEPPVGISPAGVGYIFNQEKGDFARLFSVSLVNMAVKKYLKIKVEAATSPLFGKKEIGLERFDGECGELSKEEIFISKRLLAQKEFTFRKQDQSFKFTFKEFLKSLRESYSKENFSNNSKYAAIGIFATIITISSVIRETHNLNYEIGFIAVMFVINFTFFFLLKAPTPKGRKTLGEIEGFKMFLEVAEKNLLEMSTSYAGKDITPEVFEKYLPYAMALKVENKWAKKFTDSVSAMQIVSQNNHGLAYIPAWYIGSGIASLDTLDFSSAITSQVSGALNESIKAASNSSSSGGGVFSGGGRGGG